jgi:ribonuclease HI
VEPNGFGAIIRDSSGFVVVACSTTQNSITDPLVAEVWASMIVVNLCKDVGVFDIILEGDSQQVVKEINKVSPNLSRHGIKKKKTVELNFIKGLH